MSGSNLLRLADELLARLDTPHEMARSSSRPKSKSVVFDDMVEAVREMQEAGRRRRRLLRQHRRRTEALAVIADPSTLGIEDICIARGNSAAVDIWRRANERWWKLSRALDSNVLQPWSSAVISDEREPASEAAIPLRPRPASLHRWTAAERGGSMKIAA